MNDQSIEYVLEAGLLKGARFVQSPNHSVRPQGEVIDLLVIHNISLPPGEYGTGCVDGLFCNQLDYDAHPFFKELTELRVSAHLLIDRSGAVTQYVPFDRKAWHAGQSHFCGRENCNEFSIGIELEGTDDEPYEETQYRRLAEVVTLLRDAVPSLAEAPVVGHADIAPLRKTDPGPAFDWQYFRSLLPTPA